MNMDENKVLENAAMLYGAIPGYLLGDKSKEEVAQLLVALIDSLDDIEYSRSGTPLYDVIDGNLPGRRKKSILALERRFDLTEREAHILRFAQATAKAHKYSIFKKLGVHTSEELRYLLEHYESDDQTPDPKGE